VRIVTMDRIRTSGGILDGDHQHLLPGKISKIFPHEWDHNWRLCGTRRLCGLYAECENQRCSNNPEI
jgi:hypothetical protein